MHECELLSRAAIFTGSAMQCLSESVKVNRSSWHVYSVS